MTMPPDRLDVVRVDPFFTERQRNQYASRGVAFVVLLNGAAAMVLLAILAQPLPSTEGLKAIADAMLVFSIGAVLGLTSALLAYVNRTIRLDQPDRTWRRPLRWLAVAAAVAGAASFLVGMNMARLAVLPQSSTSSHKETLRPKKYTVPQEQPTQPQPVQPKPSVPQTEPEIPPSQPTEPQTMRPPPQPAEPQQTEPNAAAPEPSAPQSEPEAPKAQSIDPPTMQPPPQPVEPQQTEPQQL